MQKLFLGSDHAGLILKSAILKHLSGSALEIIDVGTNSSDSCHYPDFATKLAKNIQDNPEARGILVCGSGIGVSMVANRFKGVRAALCRSTQDALLSRQHNNANVLCLGERVTPENLAFEITDKWLNEQFEGGRHQNRVDLFDNLGQ